RSRNAGRLHDRDLRLRTRTDRVRGRAQRRNRQRHRSPRAGGRHHERSADDRTEGLLLGRADQGPHRLRPKNRTTPASCPGTSLTARRCRDDTRAGLSPPQAAAPLEAVMRSMCAMVTAAVLGFAGAAHAVEETTDNIMTGSGLVCDTKEQAERFVSLMEDNVEKTLLAVNREAGTAHACVVATIGF